MRGLGFLTAVAVFGGCYDPTVPGLVPCGANGACPTGQSCVAGTCSAEAPPVDAPIGADARPDAAPGDTDGDGVANALDNCVTVANTDQHDEDGDDHGDVCDNCPHVANADQLDVMEGAIGDGVGDECDPRPTSLGDRIDRFIPFTSMPADLELTGTWTIVAGDAARHSSLSYAEIAVPGTRADVGLLIQGTTITVTHTDMYFAVYAGQAGNQDHSCGYYDAPSDYHVGFGLLHVGPSTSVLTENHLPEGLGDGVPYAIGLQLEATTDRFSCATFDPRDQAIFEAAAPAAQPGTVGVVVNGASVELDYLVIYGH